MAEKLPYYLHHMLHLVNDDLNACIADLNQGISLNNQNEALNNDMRKIISEAEQAQSSSSSSSKLNKEQTRSDGTHHILLSAYQRDDDIEH
ncbi:MAG: hypothetical protein AB2792_21535 [Candidatus Thiodiazotropha sp.]